MLALRHAARPMAVLYNLVTSSSLAAHEDAPLYERDIYQDLCVSIHFAGSVMVPESFENPFRFCHYNIVKSNR